MKLWVKMLLGLFLGVISGICLGEKAHYLKPVGTIFLGLLNMLVVLLIFSSMTVGVTSINDMKKLGRVGLKTLVLFMVTTALAIILALFIGKLINPGMGIPLNRGELPVSVDDTPELINMLLSLVPQNPISALANGHILQVIVFSIFLE